MYYIPSPSCEHVCNRQFFYRRLPSERIVSLNQELLLFFTRWGVAKAASGYLIPRSSIYLSVYLSIFEPGIGPIPSSARRGSVTATSAYLTLTFDLLYISIYLFFVCLVCLFVFVLNIYILSLSIHLFIYSFNLGSN